MIYCEYGNKVDENGCQMCACNEPPRKCCRAMTAECLSCAAGVSEAEYCAANPRTYGCEPPRMCCMAMISSCLACSAGISEAEYCAANPNTVGCEPAPTKAAPIMGADKCTWGPSYWCSSKENALACGLNEEDFVPNCQKSWDA